LGLEVFGCLINLECSVNLRNRVGLEGIRKVGIVRMNRRLLGLVLATAASLLIASPASAAEYEAFVGCDDLAANPIPSHLCQYEDFPGAFFEADVDTEYDACVELPAGTVLCAEEQLAEAGSLHGISLPTESAGDYLVGWFVEDAPVEFWEFRLHPPPLPPPAPTISPPAVSPPPVAAPSLACLMARKRVGKFNRQLKSAKSKKQKAKIRVKLKNARAGVKRAC
jgi:hypothetical protein